MRERTSTRWANSLQHLRMRARFDFDEDVSILPIAAIEKLVGNAGFAPDRVSRLLMRFANAAVIEGHLVPALRQRHDEVWQQMLVPWLALARVERYAPHPHQIILEHDLVANRSQHTHRCSLPCHDLSNLRPLALTYPLSLPGLTRQSIHLCKTFLRRRWMPGSSPRMTSRELLPSA